MLIAAEFRRRLAATCLVLIAAACSSSDGASPIDGQEIPSTDDADDDATVVLPPATTVPRIPNAASADVLRQERRYSLADPLGPLQREHGVAPVQLGPGEHTTDALGIETTLRLDRWWRLESEEVGSFWLTRPDAPVAALLPAIVFLRPVGLVVPTRVAEGDLFQGEHPVPPDDLGGWLDAVPQLEVLDRGSFTVGERVGEWFDVDVRDDAGPLLDGCSPDRCVWTWWSGGSGMIVARDGESLRYYSFPDPAGPIYVLVAAEDDEFQEWNELAAGLLADVVFGPSAPHPAEPGVSAGTIRSHEAGSTWRFALFPGLTVTAERFSISNQRPGLLEFQPFQGFSAGSRAGIVRPVATFAGEPLDTVDEVVETLIDAGLRRDEDAELPDRAVAVFDGAVEGPVFRRAELEPGDDPAFVGWPEFIRTDVRIWVLDTPVGPLLLMAAGGGESELSVAIPQAESLGRSIAFD